jgi:hypothetical protein
MDADPAWHMPDGGSAIGHPGTGISQIGGSSLSNVCRFVVASKTSGNRCPSLEVNPVEAADIQCMTNRAGPVLLSER